jgi:CheY-like chemotaxis protein
MTRTVFVVDDDAGIRELLKYKLTESGYDVAVSANGQECLDSLRAGSLPDVALLDVMMPRMDGLEVLETIRTEFGTAPPVILLTGADPRADVTTAAAAGRISKPFTMAEVTTCIERVLGE